MINNIKKITDQLTDAIVGSGKSITDIPFSTLSEFLGKNGIPRHLHTSIVSNLETIFKDKFPSKIVDKSKEVKHIESKPAKEVSTKSKEPNKNLFGEIKKIT